jgi:hypothetical protein
MTCLSISTRPLASGSVAFCKFAIGSTSQPRESRHGRRGDEVVFQLETLLMFQAAYDAVARVAHVVHFGIDYSNVGWRHTRWRERLSQTDPTLAAIADDGARGGTLLQIVGTLRTRFMARTFEQGNAIAPASLHSWFESPRRKQSG